MPTPADLIGPAMRNRRPDRPAVSIISGVAEQSKTPLATFNWRVS